MTRIAPAFSAFEKVYAKNSAQVLSTRLIADLETPVSAYIKLSATFGPGFMLESVEGGAVRGRYSVLGFTPDAIFHVKNGHASLSQHGSTKGYDGDIFASLRKFLQDSRIVLPEHLPPMSAGVFGVMSYDCVRFIEVIGDELPDPLGLPDMRFLRPTLVVIFDAVKDDIHIVTPVRYDTALTARNSYDEAAQRLNTAVATMRLPIRNDDQPMSPPPLSPPRSNTQKQRYLDMVAEAKDYIAAGDAFQIVLAQRFETEFTLSPFALYRALRRVNPSPYLFFFDFDDFALVGSSPEICVQVRGDKVTVRPIAGTIRRGATPAEDKTQGEKLLADPKERSEHLMLLDLGRNDVGRVAQMGSVKVEEQYTLEHYSEVIHIVSQVGGTLDKQFDAIDALKATFPAGTVSGAPKVRAMQIINKLETHQRGIYAGCVGYFSANGDMDSCIVLRTGIVKNGKLYAQAGAGIVADSIAENEYAECEAKARALFRAAAEAITFASGDAL